MSDRASQWASRLIDLIRRTPKGEVDATSIRESIRNRTAEELADDEALLDGGH